MTGGPGEDGRMGMGLSEGILSPGGPTQRQRRSLPRSRAEGVLGL